MEIIFDLFLKNPLNIEENKDEYFIDFTKDFTIDNITIDKLLNTSYIFIIILF